MLENRRWGDRARSHGDDVISLLLNQGGGRRDNSKARGRRFVPIGGGRVLPKGCLRVPVGKPMIAAFAGRRDGDGLCM